MTTPREVLDFWFGAPGSPEQGKPRGEWFRKAEAFDTVIRERFLPLYQTAATDGLSTWDAAPLSLLALIIVLDQFPRNMFRDDARAYAADAAALAAAERMVARGWDRELEPFERWFAYMPYQHAENLAPQRRSLELFGRLTADSGLDEPSRWARKHHDVIERFGRFPQRNVALGRTSTPAEIEFIGQPGSAF